jgi:transcriptional regulator with XRE-family HTH domain
MSEYEIDLYRIIGEMIREIRLSKGMSLEEVSNELGFTRKTLQRYETGEHKIKIGTIIKLSNILGFNYDKFMSDAKLRLVGKEPLVREQTYYADEETRKIA